MMIFSLGKTYENKICVYIEQPIVLVLFMRFSSHVYDAHFFHILKSRRPISISYLSVLWFFFRSFELSINKILCRLENVDQTDVKISRYTRTHSICYDRAFRWFVLGRNVYCVRVWILHYWPAICLCTQNTQFILFYRFISFRMFLFWLLFQVLSSIHQMDFNFIFETWTHFFP